jgi:hypothetical protein
VNPERHVGAELAALIHVENVFSGFGFIVKETHRFQGVGTFEVIRFGHHDIQELVLGGGPRGFCAEVMERVRTDMFLELLVLRVPLLVLLVLLVLTMRGGYILGAELKEGAAGVCAEVMERVCTGMME